MSIGSRQSVAGACVEEKRVELLLDVEGLKKSFGGVAALRDGRFELRAGSVHALCGGNGAGKSTFLKILMGIHNRDAGSIRRRGKDVDFAGPADALASGIAIIEQELSPVPHMTVAENIYLGREPSTRFGGIDFRTMNRSAQGLLDDLEFDIRATQYMMNLSVAQMQLVEIAKALSHDAEVIFMDEPTSAIGEKEAQQLFAAIRRLKGQDAASSMSRTGFRKSSRSPIPIPCFATVPMSAAETSSRSAVLISSG